MTLYDNQGKTYKAMEWTGNRGWHHVSGDIIFPEFDSQADQVIFEINGIEGMKSSFNWDFT